MSLQLPLSSGAYKVQLASNQYLTLWFDSKTRDWYLEKPGPAIKPIGSGLSVMWGEDTYNIVGYV